jgi:ComF family protein
VGRTSSPDHVASRAALRKAARKPKRIAGPAQRLASLIFPQRSLVTNRELPGPGAIEPEHWSQLVFLGPPQCQRCGLAFGFEAEPRQLCAACLAHPPAYERARAALQYGDVSRGFVLALKRAGRRDGLALFAGWMHAAALDLAAEADLIVPVPLHYFRHVRRGFNQSVWLAAALSRRTNIRLCVDALVRRRATPSQAGLDPGARRRNVEGAFRARKSRKGRLKGARVLLVDDVFTTGATAEACAKALLRGGARCVDVVTLARVAGPRSVPI